MRSIGKILSGFLVIALAGGAEATETVAFGDAEVILDYQLTEEGVATLTLNALISETNDSLRGLKNTDPRRLRKLGQLIYQCKLLLHDPDKTDGEIDARAPVLVSSNFSLFTGVDLQLAAGELVGIRVQALRAVDDESLFSPSLGDRDIHREVWENVGEGTAVNLKQLSVNVLRDTDVLETAASIDIIVKFPVFQMQKPASRWSYNFVLNDFKQAVRHADANCTPAKLVELIQKKSDS